MSVLLDEVRLTRDALRYGYAVGKVGVLQARTFDRATYERLLDATDFAEQKRLLSETPYGRYIEGARTPAEVERALADALESFYGFLGEAALPESVARYFRIRYDYANLKAAVKAQLLGAPIEGLLVEHGSVPVEAFLGELADLPEPLASAVPAMDEASSERRAGDEDEALAVDTAIDRSMFAELLSTAGESRSAYLVELARTSIDVANIRTIVRARLAGRSASDTTGLLSEGGTLTAASLGHLAELQPEEISGALGAIPQLKPLAGQPLHLLATLDVSLDGITAAALRRGRSGQIGPEPVIAYVTARESEVTTLRTLLLGKLAGLSNETLRTHLRALD